MFFKHLEKIMFYYCALLHAFLLSSSTFLHETSSVNMNYVVDSYPKKIETQYQNEIIYEKAPTPWRKILNSK